MKRVPLFVVAAAFVAAIAPAAVLADKATHYQDHRVSVFCEGEVEGGGFVTGSITTSQQFGDSAEVLVWLGDAIPFEDDVTFFGAGDSVAVSEGATVEAAATLTWFDADGEAGSGSMEASLTPFGDPIVETEGRFGNQNSHTTRTIQFLEGEGTVTLPDATELALPCFGDVTDEKVLQSNPHTFVLSNAGVVIDCGWSLGEDGFAFFFGIADSFGSFADAAIFTPDLEASGSIDQPDLDANGVHVSIPLENFTGGDPITADVSATFDPFGPPVTSTLIAEGTKLKVVEQRLTANGTVEFSTGDTFTMETCFANTFDQHQASHVRNGPKVGPAPSNDTPEGAIALSPGDRVRVNTSGAALEAEIPITTCPDGGADNMGKTVWYTVEGTGGELTADTKKSNFDTVIAVYVMEGDELVEIGCNDDVQFEPIGATLQAAITGPTEEGVTYWIQVGGFQQFFDPEQVDSGRLVLRIR